MKVALDTNCLLDAANSDSCAYGDVKKILGAAAEGKLELFISLHSLAERTKDDARTGRAREIGATINRLPHYPVGARKEQVCTWNQMARTWQEAERNQQILGELSVLAKSGSKIRDHGAYIDALLGGVDVFVTSDLGLAGSGPAKRIETKFGLRVITPSAMSGKLGLCRK